jgi:hypothetical protein
MATAPKFLGLTTIDIDINGGAEQPDVILTGGLNDTLTFNNYAPFPVDIKFFAANGPVFNNVEIAADEPQNGSQSPQQTQITVNYNIYNHDTGLKTGGPYGVQVGVGTATNPAPLLIPVISGSPAPEQATISVPSSGWIRFNIKDNVAYQISWDPPAPPDAFNTPKTIGPGLTSAFQAKQGIPVNSAGYTLAAMAKTPGHGTVKIGS